MNNFKVVEAASVLSLFAEQRIRVQEAVEVEAEDKDGKKAKRMETSLRALKAAHVISAKQYDDGRVTITTIDGNRFEAMGKAPVAADAKN
jgi:hypothetical protein